MNPDLIGASYALKDGDLAMYDHIMSGRKSVDLEDLMKMGDDSATIAKDNEKNWVNSDSELQ